jgi:hypothetical protein
MTGFGVSCVETLGFIRELVGLLIIIMEVYCLYIFRLSRLKGRAFRRLSLCTPTGTRKGYLFCGVCYVAIIKPPSQSCPIDVCLENQY